VTRWPPATADAMGCGEKAYIVRGQQGKASLLDLFEGRRQRFIYRALFEPESGWPEHAASVVRRGRPVSNLAPYNARDDHASVCLPRSRSPTSRG